MKKLSIEYSLEGIEKERFFEYLRDRGVEVENTSAGNYSLFVKEDECNVCSGNIRGSFLTAYGFATGLHKILDEFE